MERYAEFIEHLRISGWSGSRLNTAMIALEELYKWDKGGSAYDQLKRHFGLDRSLYVLVSNLNDMMYRKAPKNQVMTAMRELGFRQEVRSVCGVQMRVWIRGRWTDTIPVYGPKTALEVPPCPVPPPPC